MTTEDELRAMVADLQAQVARHEASLKFVWVALTEMQKRFDLLESFVVAVSSLTRTLSGIVENLRGGNETIPVVEPSVPVIPPKTHGPEIA